MRTKYQVAMERMLTTWFEIEASSQEEAEQKFIEMVRNNPDDLYEEESMQWNVTKEHYDLYEDLDKIKEI